MSMFTKLPSEFYDATAFDGFSPDRDFHLGTAKAMAKLAVPVMAASLWPTSLRPTGRAGAAIE